MENKSQIVFLIEFSYQRVREGEKRNRVGVLFEEEGLKNLWKILFREVTAYPTFLLRYNNSDFGDWFHVSEFYWTIPRQSVSPGSYRRVAPFERHSRGTNRYLRGRTMNFNFSPLLPLFGMHKQRCLLFPVMEGRRRA